MKPLALTMGDPAGIGGELTLRTWLALRGGGRPFVALDDPARLERLARAMGSRRLLLTKTQPVGLLSVPDSIMG